MISESGLAMTIRHQIMGLKDDELPIGRSISYFSSDGGLMWAMRRIINLKSENAKQQIVCDLIEVEEPTPNRYRSSGSPGVYGTVMFRVGDLHFLGREHREKLGTSAVDPNVIIMDDFQGSLGYFTIQKYSATVLAAQIYLKETGLLENKNLLVLGSSDGPQALAAIKLGGAYAMCIDINRCEEVHMRKHALHNGLEAQISFLQGDVSKPDDIIFRLPDLEYGVLVSNLGNHYQGTEEGTIAIASHLAERQKISFVLGGYVYNVDADMRHLSSRKILRRLKDVGFRVTADLSYGDDGVITYILQN